MLLRALHRGLTQHGLSTEKLFDGDAHDQPASIDNAASVATEEPEALVRAAYARLAKQPAAWVTLADLRDELVGLSRTEVDLALRGLARSPGVRLIPVANLKSLTSGTGPPPCASAARTTTRSRSRPHDHHRGAPGPGRAEVRPGADPGRCLAPISVQRPRPAQGGRGERLRRGEPGQSDRRRLPARRRHPGTGRLRQDSPARHGARPHPARRRLLLPGQPAVWQDLLGEHRAVHCGRSAAGERGLELPTQGVPSPPRDHVGHPEPAAGRDRRRRAAEAEATSTRSSRPCDRRTA